MKKTKKKKTNTKKTKRRECLVCGKWLADSERLTYTKKGKSYEKALCLKHQKDWGMLLKYDGKADRVFMEAQSPKYANHQLGDVVQSTGEPQAVKDHSVFKKVWREIGARRCNGNRIIGKTNVEALVDLIKRWTGVRKKEGVLCSLPYSWSPRASCSGNY